MILIIENKLMYNNKKIECLKSFKIADNFTKTLYDL
jgi:hypothetical protein